MLIAIDGPAASGKGTVAKQIAAHFGMEYLDTGRLYRLVGWELMRSQGITSERLVKNNSLNSELRHLATEIANEIDPSQINNEDIETEEVGKWASMVSAIPAVREALLEFQRNVAKSPKGAVLDGRDIGTIVCPGADFKFYITAEARVRAKRRFMQLEPLKEKVKEEDILKDILSRDKRDEEREVAPLIPAADAIFIDSTHMSVEDVFEKVKDIIDSRN